MSTESYLLDNRAPDARTRFEALSALFDQGTMRRRRLRGEGPGGGAGRSEPVARRSPAAGRAGRPDRLRLATDLDVGWMSTDLPENVEVRRHDVATDEPPDPGFDLVHARLVLVHVPQRDEALQRMVAALRPGGMLLIEDFDVDLQPLACVDARREVEHRANRVRAGFLQLLAQRGADPAYGRALPRLLRAAGLTDVAADALLRWRCPPPRLSRSQTSAVEAALISQNRASADEVDAHLRAVAADSSISQPRLWSPHGPAAMTK